MSDALPWHTAGRVGVLPIQRYESSGPLPVSQNGHRDSRCHSDSYVRAFHARARVVFQQRDTFVWGGALDR